MDVQDLSANTGSSRDEIKLVNRLSESRSPYVRGHMDNPVAWQMWDAQALELAKKSNRLLFVSIGYAACHWCHVMEHESFENEEVAKILNASFIPIKIDREERPDIDRIYMNYVQATSGSGGWPLNVFITPDLEPIFGGTYFPGPGSTMGAGQHVGFVGILEKIRDVWQNQRQRCLDSAKEITSQLKDFAQEGTISRDGHNGEDALDLDTLEEAYEHFARKFDRRHGGFGGAPKFPTPVNLAYLLKLGQYPSAVEDVIGKKEIAHGKDMVLQTLRAMDHGGIHDLIGNGFARYSVTNNWSLPHFEKMLYDQGQLLPVYLDAYLRTQDPQFLSAVHDIATYLTTPPMHSPTGGFFSAEDADSLYHPNDKQKREGAFYVWTLKEFQSILGDRDAEVLARYYDVHENGNVSPEHDAHDELINQNVLNIRCTPEALSKEFGFSIDEVRSILKEGRQKLLEYRNKERPRPALDDKIVTAWNGLAIGALARTSSVVQDSEPEKAATYLEAAKKAAAFIKDTLYDTTSKTLKRVYREVPGDTPGFADDYAFLISGLIDLYQSTFDDAYLAWADDLQQTQLKVFWDSNGLGFFSTAEGQNDLILRLKDGMDNAEPSANGISAQNLDRLGGLLEDEDYIKRARETLSAFEAEITQHPFLFTSLLDSVVIGKLGAKNVVVTGEGQRVEEWLKKLRTSPVGLGTVARVGGGAKSEWLKKRNPLVGSQDVGREGVYICEGHACRDALEMGMEDVGRAIRDV